MKKIIFITLCFGFLFGNLYGQGESEKEVLAEMLSKFLDGAGINDYETHDEFWSEELIYTGSDGNRITKSDIMNNLESPSPGNPEMKYYAEEVEIRIFDDAAVVAFKLVAEIGSSDNKQYYYNTGTFKKRIGYLESNRLASDENRRLTFKKGIN